GTDGAVTAAEAARGPWGRRGSACQTAASERIWGTAETMTSRRSQLNAERTEATRTRLMRHATKVFEKPGYGAASVADIVPGPGVPRGTFSVHFRSKRDIFLAVVEAVKAELLAAQTQPVVGARTVADAVRRGLVQYLRAYKASARMIGLIEET